MKNVFILGAHRIPFVKSWTSYSGVTIPNLMTAALDGLVKKTQIQGLELGDVSIGSLLIQPKDWGLARESVLGSGLHPETPAFYTQRACGTSLESVNAISLKIAAGQIQSGIAGGVDSNSDVPAVLPRALSWKLMELRQARSLGERAKILAGLANAPWIPEFPTAGEPRTGLSMGDHCELMVKEWKISREAQDQLAYESHHNGARALREGFFNDLMGPFQGVTKDSILRADTSVDRLAKLKPAFDRSSAGTLTAGNSTPMTDGAAAVLLGNESFAKERALEPWARVVDVEVAAVDFVKGAGLLMAPTVAVHRLLKRQGLKLQDFDFYEIHEAFAGQVLCTLKAWESDDYCRRVLKADKALGTIDRSRMNINGSSLALGHPFSATGARITGTLAKMLRQKKGRGLISVCTAGGMGVTAILESV
jgi:acetyl-CoA C-acetyltransferase